MKLARRQFLHLAAGAAALPVISVTAWALDYPTRPVRIIVGYPAGIGPDIVGRLIGGRLSKRLGQQFVIENRPGAGGNVGTEIVVRAPPDGCTLLWVVTANAINTTLYNTLNFNFIRDVAPVASVGRIPFVMVVNPSVPAKSIPEFFAYAKANPGKVNMASQGIGVPSHVFGELFKMMAGIDLAHVPYRTNFMPDLLAGQVQVAFLPIVQAIEFVRTGKVRALAVTTATRSEALPDVPVMAEFVPGYEASAWHGVGAPKDTPARIVDAINKEINASLAEPDMKASLVGMGIAPLSMTPAQFGKFIADETAKWAKVILAANIKAE
jgi:tripartite-type tricarboxylate transporter receptor subunit TctC